MRSRGRTYCNSSRLSEVLLNAPQKGLNPMEQSRRHRSNGSPEDCPSLCAEARACMALPEQRGAEMCQAPSIDAPATLSGDLHTLVTLDYGERVKLARGIIRLTRELFFIVCSSAVEDVHFILP